MTDTLLNRLQLYDNSGKVIATMGQTKLTKLLGDWHFRPQCLATTAGGQVYVTDLQDKCIKQFDSLTRRCVATIPLENYSRPYSVGVLPNGQFVVTHCDDFMTLHDVTGSTLRTIHSDGNLCCVTCDKNGRIIATDTSNHCVKVFDAHGNNIDSFGQTQMNGQALSSPHGVCTDDDGHVYVADTLNHRVCKFDSNGVFIDAVLTEQDGILWPRSVACDGHNIAVTWQQGVSVFAANTNSSTHRLLTTRL